MGSHSSAELSLPSTPLLCAPTAETATRRAMPRRKTVPHSGELANGRTGGPLGSHQVGRSCCGGGREKV